MHMYKSGIEINTASIVRLMYVHVYMRASALLAQGRSAIQLRTNSEPFPDIAVSSVEVTL